MTFRDRADAGRKLAEALERYKGRRALVLGIPRGGVHVAYEVARGLQADLSILISRKLAYPDNPEAGFGAVAEDGSRIVSETAQYELDEAEISAIIREQEKEIQRRIKVLRRGQPLPPIRGKTVILVDDGLAMGSTMTAAIALCRRQKAKRIVVAVPVAGDWAAREITKLADETVILTKPVPFFAVAQVYEKWYDVPDREVLNLMAEWAAQRGAAAPEA
ncbi:MAG TPA: phosphoribosyltransferase family protein [Candidatus Bathyarchaeia archaeon]|nr:phosphoribosyltransferase family protein [Candidatus Bathyarchaeia archaeon]